MENSKCVSTASFGEFDSPAHDDRRFRIYVQHRNPLAEIGRPKSFCGAQDQFFFLQEDECFLHSGSNSYFLVLRAEKCVFKKFENVIFGHSLVRSHETQKMHPQWAVRRKLRPDRFRGTLDVYLVDFPGAHLISRKEDDLSERVVSRSACSPRHLFELENADGRLSSFFRVV